MGKTKLKFRGLTEIVGTEKLALLVLTDMDETIQISIVCDQQMENQFGLRLGKAPMLNRLLPEVLSRVLREQTDLTFEILINDVRDGQYCAFLCNKETFDIIPMRASDAVLLSFVGGIPLYMDDDLMHRQATPFHNGAMGMALPVNTISDEMLKSALDKAIKEENYELASHLRDEQKRRKSNTAE